jgi:hypothetical protein
MGEASTGDRQRLTVREAAEVLRISQHAIRQRIRRNTLVSEKTADGRVYVLLERDLEVSGEPSEESPEESSGVDPVQMLREHNQILREQLAEAHAANRENRRIIAGLIQRVPELESPRDEPHGPETKDAETTEGTYTPAAQVDRETGVQRRSWWRRFFGVE